MATELLERMVMAYFDETDLTYAEISDDSVHVILPSEKAGIIGVLIIDQEFKSTDILSAAALHIALFPKSRMPSALRLCNDLNLNSMGAFSVDENGSVDFKLDWHVADRSNPKETKLMLSFVIASINESYPKIMASRWGVAAPKRANKRKGR